MIQVLMKYDQFLIQYIVTAELILLCDYLSFNDSHIFGHFIACKSIIQTCFVLLHYQYYLTILGK